MVENNLLKEYYLWSDLLLLTKGTEFKIPKTTSLKEKDNKVYDSLTDTYVEPPLMYCHIIDMEILNEDADYQYCKAVKIREVAY